MPEKKLFDIHKEYDFYLNKVGIDKNKMHPVQYLEMKKSFIAAITQFLVHIMHEWGEDDNEEYFFKDLDNVEKECFKFWDGQVAHYNKSKNLFKNINKN